MRCLALLITLVLCTFSITDARAATEAEILALDVSGELLPPPALVTQATTDLAAIRAEYEYFDILGITAAPDWPVGVILVRLTEAANQEYLNGTYTGLDGLNAQYGPLDIEYQSNLRTLKLTFQAPYQPVLLADIYAQADGVEMASASFVGSDSSDITWDGGSEYVLDLGWGDCSAGCFYHHYWRIEVSGAVVTLLESWGDPVTVAAEPFVATQVFLQAPRPNPVSQTTRIGFVIRQEWHVDLRVFDVAGRLVRVLLDETEQPGPHWTTWDARDEDARPVASGTYFIALRAAENEPVVRSVVVLR